MPMSPEVREKLLVETREAAAAFLEDMAHLRAVLNRSDAIRGELRRISNELRRLLVDGGGDLPNIAAPRVGRLMYSAPDNNPLYKSGRTRPYSYCASGAASFFGMSIRGMSASQGNVPRYTPDFDPDRTVILNQDGFLAQRLLCMNDKWVTRRQVIKYVANTASGVHSGTPQEEADQLLARIRQGVTYSLKGGNFCLALNFDAFNPAINIPFKHEPDALDPVLVELLSTAQCLATSPSIVELEEAVRRELSAL